MKHCSTCDRPLPRGNKTGYCKAHIADCASYRESQRVAALRRKSDPVEVERMRRIMVANAQSEKAKAARRERCIRERLWERGHAALKADPTARERSNRGISDTRLAGIPRDARDHYRFLTAVKRIPAPEARQMALDHHEAEMARFRREIAA
jgi:hypothetical protein